MIKYVFEVPGTPMAWKRARATVRFGHASRFEDKRQTSYKADIRSYLRKQCGKPVASPCPFTLMVQFDFPLLKGDYTSKGKLGKHGQAKLNGEELMTKKPDLDNLVKMVMDALNGVVWLDDSQVWQIVASKGYSDKPKTTIRLFGKESPQETPFLSVERYAVDDYTPKAENAPSEAETGGKTEIGGKRNE